MATVTGVTADRSQAIEDAAIVSAAIDSGTGHLIFTTHDGTPIDAGSVVGVLDGDLTTIAGLSPANNDVIQRIAGAWANRTMTQLKASLAIGEADVSGLTTDLATLTAALALTAPAASPTFTGTITAASQTLSGRQIITPDALSVVSAHVSTDASTGNHFAVAATAAFTLDNPTNPVNGQRIDWAITQDATGGRVMTLGSAFSFGTDITAAVLTTTASKTDYLGAVYNSAASKWHIVAFVKGY